jgi:hypothetical protein
MACSIFWHEILPGLVEDHPRVRRTYNLHLHVRRVSEARNQQDTSYACCLLHADFLLGLLFDRRYAVVQLAEALCYKPEDRGF